MAESRYIDVRADPKQLAELEVILAGFKDAARKSAVASAINRSLTTVRAIAAREIVKEVLLPVGRVKDRLKIIKATKDTQQGRIRIDREEIPLGYFKGVRQTKQGVTVTVRPGKRDLIKHAFIANVGPRSGNQNLLFGATHRGVFMRASVTGGPKRRERRAGNNTELPIRQLRGPTLLGTVQRAPAIVQKTLDEAGPVLIKNLASQADRLMNPKKLGPPETA